MIQFYNTTIQKSTLHLVGNKTNDEGVKTSKKTLVLDEDINLVLTNYFFKSFLQKEEMFQFNHETDLNLNEVYHYLSNIFKDINNFQEQSINLAKHLYEQSIHPKIKGGEFYVVYFNDCIVNDITMDAIGLFKSENKDIFLKVFPQGDGFEIESEKGVNINKLDKGCLIFNIEKENGYVILTKAQMQNTGQMTSCI